VFWQYEAREPDATSGHPRRRRRPRARQVLRVVRVLPAVHGRRDRPPRHAARRDRPVALRRRDGVRRGVPASDPPDRRHQPQGAQQHHGGRARRRRQPVGHRRSHRRAPRPRHRGRRACARRRVPPARDRAGARHRVPVHARPPLGHRAPGLVHHPRRRHDPVRREPTEEVPGHLPDQLRDRRLAGALGGARRRVPVLDRAGRDDLPRRQPAHQGVPVLGVVRRHVAHRAPGDDLPGRGVHPSPRDGAPRQARIQPVVHVLHVAPVGSGAARVLHRPRHPDRRLLPAERVAEHARHPHRAAPARRTRDVRRQGDPRLDAQRELGGVRPGVRAARASADPGGVRGVPRLREVPAPPVVARRPGVARAAPHAPQRDPAGAAGVAASAHAAVPRRRRARGCSATRRPTRSELATRSCASSTSTVATGTTGRPRRPHLARHRSRARRRVRDHRPARRRDLPLARVAQLRRSDARPRRGARLRRPPDRGDR
jgi:hypothetical protein